MVSTTDQAGHFRFANVEAGRYNLTTDKEGFLDATYGADRFDDDGSILKVSSGSRIEGLSLPLFPVSTISGQLRDVDGDPVRGEVTLWTREQPHGKFSEVEGSPLATNLTGEYRFEGLHPGSYSVSADRGSGQSAAKRVRVDNSGKIIDHLLPNFSLYRKTCRSEKPHNIGFSLDDRPDTLPVNSYDTRKILTIQDQLVRVVNFANSWRHKTY